MSERNERKLVDTDALFWGVLLVGLGTVFLLERLHIGDFHYLLRNYWPLFLVAIGVSKFFKPGGTWSGLWLIALGAWLSVVTLHLFDLTYGSAWPLLLIVLGAGMVLRTLFEGAGRFRRQAPSENSPDPSPEVRHDG